MERQLQLARECRLPGQFAAAARIPERSHEQIRRPQPLEQGRPRRQPTCHLGRPPDRVSRGRQAGPAEHVAGAAPWTKSVCHATAASAATATATAAAAGRRPAIHAEARLPGSEAEREDAAGAGRAGRGGAGPRTRRADVLWRGKPAAATAATRRWWRPVQFRTAMVWRRWPFRGESRTVHERIPRTSESPSNDG